MSTPIEELKALVTRIREMRQQLSDESIKETKALLRRLEAASPNDDPTHPPRAMTLARFKTLTSGMPDSTPILFLNPWWEMEPAAIVTAADLVGEDPLKEDFPADAIVITGDAELTDRETL